VPVQLLLRVPIKVLGMLLPLFFSNEAKKRRESQIISQEAPFLYSLLMGFLTTGNMEEIGPNESHASNPVSQIPGDPFEAQLMERDGITYTMAPNETYGGHQRAHHVRIKIP